MTDTVRRDELREALATLTPWHGSLSRDPADGFLRRCIDVQCLGSSPIVATTDEDVTVEHRPGCAVAEFMRRLAAPAAEPQEGLDDACAKGPAVGWRWAAQLRELHRHGLAYETLPDGVRAALAAAAAVDRAAAQPGPSEPGLADLASQLVLRIGHLPSCGEDAEFAWDCTCDYAGFMERMGRVLAAADSAPGEGLDPKSRFAQQETPR